MDKLFGVIYCITNKVNDKKYIGQTINFQRRMWEHKYSKTKESYLKNSIQKYGINNFKFEIIERVKIENLNKREIYWIDFYNTFKGEGYNLTIGGDAVGKGKNHWWYGKELSQETKDKISKANKGENNGMYGVIGEEHHSYHNSKITKKISKDIINKRLMGLTLQEIADNLNICAATALKVLHRNHWTSKNLNKEYQEKLNIIENRRNKKPWDNVIVIEEVEYKLKKSDNYGKEKIKKILNYKKKHPKSTLKQLSKLFEGSSSTISKIINGKHPLTRKVGE